VTATDGDLIAVGRIGKPRGVRGEVFVEPWTDSPDERFGAGVVLQTDPPEPGPLTVTAISSGGNRLVMHFAGVDDRSAAEALRGVRLVMRADERPDIEDPDEFYVTDLVGLAARTPAGDDLGPVRDVLHIGDADYLVLDVRGAERLVPAIVPEIDVAGGTVVVDPPEGLFEL